MEPAADRRGDKTFGHLPLALAPPQWSPPLIGGVTALTASQITIDLKAPMEPPLIGGVTGCRGSAG
ncbi:MAG: hypothetical protein ACRDPO_36440 [Streptosporangiaceae bacterium]